MGKVGRIFASAWWIMVGCGGLNRRCVRGMPGEARQGDEAEGGVVAIWAVSQLNAANLRR